ncbi:MAG: RDD family protein [Cytophagaceae bacterium]
MKYLKSLAIFLFASAIFYITYRFILIVFFNFSLRTSNDWLILFILVSLWEKVTGYLVYLSCYIGGSFRRKNPMDFQVGGFKVAGSFQRIISAIFDAIVSLFIWFFLVSTIPFTFMGFYNSANPYSDELNDLIGNAGWLIYFSVLYMYPMFFEYKQKSSLGKMIFNNGVLNLKSGKFSFLQIFIKNILKIFPFNEVFFYLKGRTLNEFASGTATVHLNKKDENLYHSRFDDNFKNSKEKRTAV